MRRWEHIAAPVVGAVLGLFLFVALPMWRNYQHHGSAFIEQEQRLKSPACEALKP